MTATTSKLGADMRKEILDKLYELRPSDNDRGRHHFQRVADDIRAILARQPAAIDKQGAKACPECGGSLTTWKCLCDPIWPGYAAPLDKEASKTIVPKNPKDAPKMWQEDSNAALAWACGWNECLEESTGIDVCAASSYCGDPTAYGQAESVEQDERVEKIRKVIGQGFQPSVTDCRTLLAVIDARAASTSANVAQSAAIAIRPDQIAEIANKYALGNPRLDALLGFVNEVIIVNGVEYAKSE